MNSSLAEAAPWWRPDTGDMLVIRGGRPLVGSYPISGAKNAVLPLMVSALLTPHLVTLHNVPANLDVAVLSSLLQRLGCEMHWSTTAAGLSVTISADRIHRARPRLRPNLPSPVFRNSAEGSSPRSRCCARHSSTSCMRCSC